MFFGSILSPLPLLKNLPILCYDAYMANTYVDDNAKILWNYLQLHKKPVQSDIIFCLCSHDIRVAERATELMLKGYADYLVFSGGFGALTRNLFSKPEAELFADVALAAGVPHAKIIIENKSANTGENIRFTHQLLQTRAIRAHKILLVQKPYMERRTYATFKKQWPDPQADITVTSPQLSYDQYMAGGIPKDQAINVMVGDMQRIREYPKQGFQIEQHIPREVWAAYLALVKQGYDQHLAKIS